MEEHDSSSLGGLKMNEKMKEENVVAQFAAGCKAIGGTFSDDKKRFLSCQTKHLHLSVQPGSVQEIEYHNETMNIKSSVMARFNKEWGDYHLVVI